ncbi:MULTISPECIES: hypothetical protein [unclassified Caballeronia]|uniref:hypothetical protein n=1 Tax=unclassified Caballeronia TaxID=2646786 RepID=UPI00285D61B9|nr:MULTISPECIES: hypothetical protein [unclassified Caballeronia]MDR5771160.1 hypothetical protein [Caballeronia sp. LZ002]MDR5801526.1 hypothetical protein [Caballeronia sp. LZ001]MDR5846597.1 hypothetical protein [Caballeronia sp. LZ003]
MDGYKKITIRNDEEAFSLLRQAVEEELGNSPLDLSFDGWPKVEIRLDGAGYDSTITPDIAAAIVEMQAAVNRAYARLARGGLSARSLSLAEKDEIRLKAKVEKGSSLITIDLGKFGEVLSHDLVAKMTPEHLVIAVISVAAVAGATVAFKAFLKHRSEDKKVSVAAQQAVALSQQETQRLEILAKALKQNKELVAVKHDFDEVRNDILRGVGDAKTLSVNGVSLDHDTVKVVAMPKRVAADEAQLNGTYHILATDLRNPELVKLRVRRLQDEMEFLATFQDSSLDRTQVQQLQEAEWGRQPVFLSINALMLRGEVTKATVISVTPQPADNKQKDWRN